MFFETSYAVHLVTRCNTEVFFLKFYAFVGCFCWITLGASISRLCGTYVQLVFSFTVLRYEYKSNLYYMNMNNDM